MVREITVKSVLNKHKKRDECFLDEYTVNPYSGCYFNCVYCYVRASKYSEHTSNIPAAKKNAPEIFEKQIAVRTRRGEYGFIALSSATDPYGPLEVKLGFTRKILETIRYYRFPVEVATKSPLVLRDIDLLKEIDKTAILPQELKKKPGRGAIVSFSFSTVDSELARLFEPGAPSPKERLDALKKLSDEGFFTGACLMPVLPLISDNEETLDEAFRTLKEHGALFALVGGLTLYGEGPGSCRDRYYRTLKENLPELLPEYLNLYRNRFNPPAEYCRQLYERSERLCRKHGLKNRIFF